MGILWRVPRRISRRIAPQAAVLLLLVAGPAQARVVQSEAGARLPPQGGSQAGSQARSQSGPQGGESGGQKLPRAAASRGCTTPVAVCAIDLPFGPVPWVGLAQIETLARFNATARVAIAAERAAWRAPRLVGLPAPGFRILVVRQRQALPRVP